MDSLWEFASRVGLAAGNIITMEYVRGYIRDNYLVLGVKRINKSSELKRTNSRLFSVTFKTMNLAETKKNQGPDEATFSFIYDLSNKLWMFKSDLLRAINGEEFAGVQEWRK